MGAPPAISLSIFLYWARGLHCTFARFLSSLIHRLDVLRGVSRQGLCPGHHILSGADMPMRANVREKTVWVASTSLSRASIRGRSEALVDMTRQCS